MGADVQHSIVIQAAPAEVWLALTETALMRKWMGEPEMQIEITTDWAIGGPIVINGFHHVEFEAKGKVLRFEPTWVLQYSHLSSLSQLPDRPESYAIVEFQLKPAPEFSTLLTVAIAKCPTETILRHLDFYWRGAVQVLKQMVESGESEVFHKRTLRGTT